MDDCRYRRGVSLVLFRFSVSPQNHYHPRHGRHIAGQEVASQQPVEENNHREQTRFELANEYNGRRATGNRTDFRTGSDVTGKRWFRFTGRYEQNLNRPSSVLTLIERDGAFSLFFFSAACRLGLRHNQSSVATGENFTGADYCVLESLVAQGQYRLIIVHKFIFGKRNNNAHILLVT